MAAKIYRSCDRLLPKVPNGVEAWSFAGEVCKNEAVIGIITVEARLPMDSQEQKFAFVREKVKDYYLTYPKRRLRNGLIMRKEAAAIGMNLSGADDNDGEDKLIDQLLMENENF